MTLELEDIQGLWKRGHGELASAQYLLFRFTDTKKAKAYLKALFPHITKANEKPSDRAFQLAFTYQGLAFLQLPKSTLDSFSREFKEGMTESNRQFILGDFGENAPENWTWGNDEIHLLLMVFSKNSQTLEKTLEMEFQRAKGHELLLLHSLPTGLLHGHKEHFGFRDDISRPIIEELVKEKTTHSGPSFPAGEFIMGYKNLYDEYAPSPIVSKIDDPKGLLTQHPDFENTNDLGKNGTYLVFRQMSQHVFTFWKYLMDKGKTKAEAIRLGSKMVGRWPDGSPLTLCPEKSDPNQAEANDFGFWDQDKEGLKCPIGAHIRRTNPRDHLVTERSKKDAAEMAAKHQMIRKGRPYGPPVAENMEPEEIMDSSQNQEERGLHFICLVTDIRRQFEFVQNNWVNFHKFGGLENDADPIIGHHHKTKEVISDEFSMPQYPVQKKLKDMPNFTLIKGGAYFFFPGIRALKYISDDE